MGQGDGGQRSLGLGGSDECGHLITDLFSGGRRFLSGWFCRCSGRCRGGNTGADKGDKHEEQEKTRCTLDETHMLSSGKYQGTSTDSC
jgi:hypothetical protein